MRITLTDIRVAYKVALTAETNLMVLLYLYKNSRGHIYDGFTSLKAAVDSIAATEGQLTLYKYYNEWMKILKWFDEKSGGRFEPLYDYPAWAILRGWWSVKWRKLDLEKLTIEDFLAIVGMIAQYPRESREGKRMIKKSGEIPEDEVCKKCNGTGKINGGICPACQGTGRKIPVRK